MTLWVEEEVVKLNPKPVDGQPDDVEVVIRAVYRQVLGNAHVMESQRLTDAESKLRAGNITVRDFIRAVAMSDLYRSRFFETVSAYRFVELNFKHLLGRAPQDQTEIAEHVALYNTQGYEAEIESYLDSEEYLTNFGDHCVPSARGTRTQPGLKNVAFNRTFALMRGFAASDVGKSAQLVRDLGINLSTKIVPPTHYPRASSKTGKRFRIEAIQGKNAARVSRAMMMFEVGYNQLSAKIQSIQKTGGKILRIVEVS